MVITFVRYSRQSHLLTDDVNKSVGVLCDRRPVRVYMFLVDVYTPEVFGRDTGRVSSLYACVSGFVRGVIEERLNQRDIMLSYELTFLLIITSV